MRDNGRSEKKPIEEAQEPRAGKAKLERADHGIREKHRKSVDVEMKEIIDVQIGQVKAGKGNVTLQSKAIGSCIAIAAYDAGKRAGALAHVMLPGKAPAGKKGREKMRYAADAIDAIMSRMAHLGSKSSDIEVVVVGGANILDREDNTICNANIESALELLGTKGLKVRAQAVGGTDRRSVFLDVERGIVSFAEGNGRQTELWRA